MVLESRVIVDHVVIRLFVWIIKKNIKLTWMLQAHVVICPRLIRQWIHCCLESMGNKNGTKKVNESNRTKIKSTHHVSP